ncbi:hypothetical protein ACONUD_02330 [Microbulbifer harenosus]|uniref:PH domain-containing protein n=1 Tax=Microbulbifer harenosus TaxID=2576840 RepID=A0ABY2UCH9_9GAMM|nr:hypothetical protein [Microbulbifer harenosus]TLM73200.1 hypothetical protein FDY93_19140 [Microbulbifer harenosus]
MKAWFEIERPITVEADIPLKDEAPEEIKEKYASTLQGKFIAWSTSNGELIGCIKNNRSVCARIEEVKYIELYEMVPAKGWGELGLAFMAENGSCVSLIASSRHSLESRMWLVMLQEKLVNLFGIPAKYSDLGPDA